MMKSLLAPKHFETFGNLDERISWKDVRGFEREIALKAVKLDDRFKGMSDLDIRRIVWNSWQSYLVERQSFNNCTFADITVEGCIIPPLHDSEDFLSGIDDFVLYFFYQIECGTISLAEDRADLFDVDFDLRFYRGFDELEPVTRKQFLALKLAVHSRQKTLTEERFAELLSKPEKSQKELVALQQNVDYFWASPQVTYDLLKELYRECRANSVVEVDLKISRQLDETLWFAESLGLEKESIETFLRVVFRLEKLYRGKIRRSEFSRYAFSSDNPSEAHFNHFLRGIDLVLGVSDRLKNHYKEGPVFDEIRECTKSPENILELMLTVLLHDSLEDKLELEDGRVFDEEALREILSEAQVPNEIIERLVTRTHLLNSKVSIPEDEGRALSYGSYITRLQTHGDPFIRLTKIVGDIGQNLCSPHRMPFNPEDWMQLKSKYAEKFRATDTWISPYVEAGVFRLLPADIMNQMKNNKHLADHFPSFERLFQDIDFRITSLPSVLKIRLKKVLGDSFFEPVKTADPAV